MKVAKEEVINIAKLAKLKFAEEELNRFQKEMTVILEYMEKLNQLDTENIEPKYFVFEQDTLFREDKPKNKFSKEETLKNAPKRTDDFFLVPKVKD
ncbi:Asp-tRNA(Asn)/Glu-tRNA(Gln) amidotransferase subunit GatC [candidate division KSB1 bacterium]